MWPNGCWALKNRISKITVFTRELYDFFRCFRKFKKFFEYNVNYSRKVLNSIHWELSILSTRLQFCVSPRVPGWYLWILKSCNYLGTSAGIPMLTFWQNLKNSMNFWFNLSISFLFLFLNIFTEFSDLNRNEFPQLQRMLSSNFLNILIFMHFIFPTEFTKCFSMKQQSF